MRNSSIQLCILYQKHHIQICQFVVPSDRNNHEQLQLPARTIR